MIGCACFLALVVGTRGNSEPPASATFRTALEEHVTDFSHCILDDFADVATPLGFDPVTVLASSYLSEGTTTWFSASWFSHQLLTALSTSLALL